MLNPARANSWTVASCSEPFGIPSLSFMLFTSGSGSGLQPLSGSGGPLPDRLGVWSLTARVQLSKKTRALAGMTHVPVAEPLHPREHGVVVAIHEQRRDLQPIAGGLALGPQRVPGAAEEGGEAGAARDRERLFVHEADHEDLVGLVVLDHGRNQSLQLREVHRLPRAKKKPRRSGGAACECW